MRARIIRLENNELSCHMANEAFSQAKKFGLDPTYFNAIHGSTVQEHYFKEQIEPKGKFKKGRIGVLGCFFSHWYLWQECIKKGPVVILEHDGYMIRSLPDNILDQFTDVLKLDALDPYKGTYNELLELESNQEYRVEKYQNPSPKNTEKIGTGNYFKGAYSYILHPSGAEKLITWVRERGHRPADQQIGDHVLDTWVIKPTVARLNPFYSIGDNIKTQSLTLNEKLL